MNKLIKVNPIYEKKVYIDNKKVIINENTILSDLSIYNPSENLANTFYKNDDYGIGWGASGVAAYIKVEAESYSEIDMIFTQLLPSGVMGVLYVEGYDKFTGNKLNNYMNLSDAWINNYEGHSLKVENTIIANKVTYAFVNYRYKMKIKNNRNEILKIVMDGYSGYNYNPSYIKYLALIK